MNIARQILEILADRGVEIQAADGKLRYRPVDAVSPKLAAAMKQHKAAIVELLTADEWELGDELKWNSLPEPMTCSVCGPILDIWFDPHGCQRCRACDPPADTTRWLKTREKILSRESRQ